MDEDIAVSMKVNAPTLHLIFMGGVEDNVEGEMPIAVVFDEKLADEIAAYLADRFPQPEGTAIGVRLIAAHPDLIEQWARGE